MDIATQTRTNPLPWKGQFSPQLVDVLLREYAPAGGHVLDPFVGSGTVLGECARRDLAGTGIEVNPAAAILAQVYSLANRTKQERLEAWSAGNTTIERLLSHVESPGLSPVATELRPQDVVAAINTLGELPASLVRAGLVVCDPKWNSVSAARLRDAMRRLRETLVGLPFARRPIRALMGDARTVPLEAGTVDLVLTSPPYINVFNYHQQYRPAVEALGHDVLEAARSEIGSNRKHRMNRFLTVLQYAIDMARVLSEAQRVVRASGRIVVVIGRESKVRGLSILNGDLLCALASCVSHIQVEMRQERAFTNRYGERIVEDILHYRKTDNQHSTFNEAAAREVGIEFLEGILPSAQLDVRDDLLAAVRIAETVRPSPLNAAAIGD